MTSLVGWGCSGLQSSKGMSNGLEVVFIQSLPESVLLKSAGLGLERNDSIPETLGMVIKACEGNTRGLSQADKHVSVAVLG